MIFSTSFPKQTDNHLFNTKIKSYNQVNSFQKNSFGDLKCGKIILQSKFITNILGEYYGYNHYKRKIGKTNNC